MLKRSTHHAKLYKLGHDQAFHLLEARRGRGKSYTMTYWALQCVLSGVPVIANFHISHRFLAYELRKKGIFDTIIEAEKWLEKNVRYVDNWDDIVTSYDCLVLIDEVNRLFDSQDRSKELKAPRVVFEWLQQSRRNKITLVFAAQSMDWLAPRVRQLFDFLWRAKKELTRKGEIKAFWLYGGDPWIKGLSSDATRQADYKCSVPFKREISRLYDTRERIKAIPNYCQFETFFDIYNHQILHNIIAVSPKQEKSLNYKEYEELWLRICQEITPDCGKAATQAAPPHGASSRTALGRDGDYVLS